MYLVFCRPTRIAYYSVILRTKKLLRLINGYPKIWDLQVGMEIGLLVSFSAKKLNKTSILIMGLTILVF